VTAFAHDPLIRARIERAYVSTIHGFCMRLLKEHAIAAGIDPEFGVWDEAQSRMAQRRGSRTKQLRRYFRSSPRICQRFCSRFRFRR